MARVVVKKQGVTIDAKPPRSLSSGSFGHVVGQEKVRPLGMMTIRRAWAFAQWMTLVSKDHGVARGAEVPLVLRMRCYAANNVGG
jgi:hypothetical protein